MLVVFWLPGNGRPSGSPSDRSCRSSLWESRSNALHIAYGRVAAGSWRLA